MSVEIKTLSKTDTGQYIDLLRAGFGEELGQRGTDIARVGRIARIMLSCGGLPMRLIKGITGHSLFVLVAKDGASVVGALTVLEEKIPSLIGVYVIEEYRGQGIAIRLVQEALHRLQASGYTQAHVSVIDHTAQLLAQRGGFVAYDHIELYERSLPVHISNIEGASIHRTRKISLPRHAYDLGLLNIVTGVHVRRLVVRYGKEPTMAGMLIALPHQSVGEIQPRILVPGREETFRTLLDAGCQWFEQLGRKLVAVPLCADTIQLSSILGEEGFVKRRSWVEMRIDLKKRGAGL